MRIKFRKILLALILSVSLPVVTLLTGCGATPSNNLTGIVFDTMIYDEETGLPVFEVDKDVETDLKCKVFPSSASGYRVYFDPVDKGTAINSSRYTFNEGKITIHSNDFEEVRYKARAGDYTDTCIIRLKEYPVKITTDQSSMVLNSLDIVPINVQAEFVNTAGVVTHRNITENEFDFLVESSDETIINIPNENRLKFCPIRNSSSSAEVTVTILNKQGEKTGLSFKISVQIIQKVSNSFVVVSGVDEFVSDNGSADVDFNSLELNGSARNLKFNIYPINDGNMLVEGGFEYTIYLSSTKFAKVSDDGKYILIDSLVPNDYVLDIKIVIADLIMSNGSAFALDLNLTFVR